MFRLKFLSARFGDAIWITYGDPQNPHIVLIDGGTAGTRHAIQTELRKLNRSTPHLDLLVISHIDRDHIEGVLSLLEQAQSGFEVDDLWFNGWDHLAGNQEPEALGALQGERLSNRIKKLRWPWNTAFKHKSVCVPEIGALPSFTLSGGMKITLLAPDRGSLAALRPIWQKEVQAANLDPGSKQPANDDLPPESGALDIEAPIDIEALANTEFSEDGSQANGSCIALLAEYEGKRALLAADSHARTLLAGLERLSPHSRLSLDLFKLSHHGSKYTTNRELIDKVDCPTYIISTNGRVFKHPDREAIARVVHTGGKQLELVFNYRSAQSLVWNQAYLKDPYGFRTRYPEPGQEGIEIDLVPALASSGKSPGLSLKKEDRMLFSQGHALIIGVSKYQNAPYADVPIVVDDARAVAQVIQDDRLCGYPPAQVEVLSDADATRAGTLAALDRLAKRAGEKDTVFLFYCGHGAPGTDGNYYLVSHDAKIEGGRVAPDSGVSEAELIEKLAALKALRAVLIFNTCHSGSISPTLAPGEPKIETSSLSTDTASALLGTGSGRIIITACREEQKSYIGDGPLTIFTQALVEGLRGKGVGNNHGYISAYSLYEYIYTAVTDEKGQEQEPELTMIKNRGPFAVALFRGASALGEFDDSQVEVKTPAVHSVTPEKAQRSFKQVIKVGSGAAAVGNGAIAVGQNGMFIGGNVDGPVYNIRGGVHAGRDVVMGDQSNIITNQAQPQNQAEFTAALQALKAEIADLRQQADLNTAQRSNLAAAQDKVAEAAGQAQQPGAPGSRIRGALEEAKDIMELLGGGLQAAVSLGARIATLAGLAAKLFGG